MLSGVLVHLKVFINYSFPSEAQKKIRLPTGSSFKGVKTGIRKKSGKQRWQHQEGGGGGGGGVGVGGGGDEAGHSGETVDYESHQVINDFINKTDHAAVIAVTRAEG